MSFAELQFDKVLAQKQKELDEEKLKAQKLAKDMREDYNSQLSKLQAEKSQVNIQIKELQEALSENEIRMKILEKEKELSVNIHRALQKSNSASSRGSHSSNLLITSSEDQSNTWRSKYEDKNNEVLYFL